MMNKRTLRQNATTRPDRRKLARQEFDKLINATCVSGFHGSASVTMCVQDGHIQYTKVAVEKMVK